MRNNALICWPRVFKWFMVTPVTFDISRYCGRMSRLCVQGLGFRVEGVELRV